MSQFDEDFSSTNCRDDIWSYDLENRQLQLSKNLGERLGLSPPYRLEDFRRIFKDADSQWIWINFYRALRNNSSFDMYIDLSKLDLDFSAIHLIGAAKKNTLIQGQAIMVKDCSPDDVLSAEEIYFLENHPFPVVLLNESFTVTHYNKAFTTFSDAPVNGKFIEWWKNPDLIYNWLLQRRNTNRSDMGGAVFHFIKEHSQSIECQLFAKMRKELDLWIFIQPTNNPYKMEIPNCDKLINLLQESYIHVNKDRSIDRIKEGSFPLDQHNLFPNRLESILPSEIYGFIQKKLSNPKEKTSFNQKISYYCNENKKSASIGLYILPEGDFWIRLSDLSPKDRIQEKRNSLSMLNQLTGGLAHHFNNNLMGILGSLEMWKKDGIPKESQVYWNRILHFTQNNQTMIKRLLGYTKKEEYHWKPLNLKELILNQVSKIKKGNYSGLHINVIIECEDSIIVGHKDKIELAVWEVLQNGIEAMKGQGLLQITLKTKQLKKNGIPMAMGGYKGGIYLLLEISDTGCGISKRNIGRIFDPFYSTKYSQHGHGIGLSSALATITAHQGTISVQSIINKGSKFQLYFPKVKHGKVENSIFDDLPQIDKKREPYQIMLVDDEIILLEVIQDILECEGYKVVSFHLGLEALEYYKDHHKGIDMVILDMIMPQIGGRDLFHLMKKVNPSIKAMVLSGYIQPEDRKDLDELGFLEVMKKPMDREMLLNTIAKHLLKKTKNVLYDLNDIRTAKSRLGSEEELYQKLLTRFKKLFPSLRSELAGLIEKGQYKLSYPKAHQLKNQFNIIGFFNLGKKLALLEKELSQESYDSSLITSTYLEIDKEMDNVPQSLDSLIISNEEKKDVISVTRDEFTDLIITLKTALESHHLNNIEKGLQSLENHNMAEKFIEEIGKLKERCRDFQFSQALSIIEIMEANYHGTA